MKQHLGWFPTFLILLACYPLPLKSQLCQSGWGAEEQQSPAWWVGWGTGGGEQVPPRLRGSHSGLLAQRVAHSSKAPEHASQTPPFTAWLTGRAAPPHPKSTDCIFTRWVAVKHCTQLKQLLQNHLQGFCSLSFISNYSGFFFLSFFCRLENHFVSPHSI